MEHVIDQLLLTHWYYRMRALMFWMHHPMLFALAAVLALVIGYALPTRRRW